ncbi:MAG: multicopper oxidase family protein [Dehalococcoidia bacterium]
MLATPAGRRWTRRTVLGLGGGLGAALFLQACGDRPPADRLSAGTSGDASPTGSTAREGGLQEPPTIRSEGGRLDAKLTIAPALVPHGAAKRWALAVNGTSPGPTLRVRPGDHLRIFLENHSGHPTNLHTHGLRVAAAGNADNPFVEIPDGGSFAYDIDIPVDHPGGLFWYHPHFHHHVAEQLFAGFFGAIVVEDGFDVRREVAAATERLLLIHDARPGTTEDAVLTVSNMEQMTGREGSLVLVNGQEQPSIRAKPGRLERWRILNASPSRFYRLSLEGSRIHVIGSDGGRLSAGVTVDTLDLVPGERAEVLVAVQGPGTFDLKTLAVDRGSPGMGRGRPGTSGAAILARLEVSEQTALPAMPTSLELLDDLSRVNPDRTRELVFSMQGMNFFIDGRSFDPKRVDIQTRFGAVEEWTVRNSSTMDHPFHLHVWPFQVVGASNQSVQPGWKDVVNVPAGGWVRFRVRFDTHAAKTVYHCHILDHEDMGMMGIIEVT